MPADRRRASASIRRSWRWRKLFGQLQEERHRADYDPAVTYTRMEAGNIIRVADEAIAALKRAPRRDRRAFAVLLLLRRR